MKDVHGWVFRSALGPDAALAALSTHGDGFTWAIRESDTQGRYVNGTDPTGVRVRVIGDPAAELELYLPGPGRGGPLGDDAANALRARIPALLSRIGAVDVHED